MGKPLRNQLSRLRYPVSAALIVWALATAVGRERVQGQAPAGAAYSLASGATIVLEQDWAPRSSAAAPPLSRLAISAPPVQFLELQAFDNSNASEVLEFAASNNPYLGRDSRWLDTQMHEAAGKGGMLDYLFYFFFPPPRTCLNDAATAYGTAKQNTAAPDQGSTPADLEVSRQCTFGPALSDFYASELSGGLTYRRRNGKESVDGQFRKFYQPPMEQVETNGMTFYVFEAQGQAQLSLDAANHFNLPDAKQGAQSDFLWAIGAKTPFPFVRDATRKNVPLVHLALAGLGVGTNERQEFLKLLRRVK